ncbi:MAG: hypothetical protein Q4D16_20695 [Eubacteriales bacterium]|nr:hypothetical protein [Eubacteriales bacterium]
MNKEYLIGIICGMIVGVLLVAVLMKKARTDGSLKCKYDERQRLVRATGFKYSFFTLMAYDLIYGATNAVMDNRWAEDMVGMFLGICISVVVYAGYTIWNEGYFSMNENPRKVLVIFAAVAVLNFIGAFRMLSETSVIENGMLMSNSMNLICGLTFIVIFIIVFIKWQVSKREAD